MPCISGQYDPVVEILLQVGLVPGGKTVVVGDESRRPVQFGSLQPAPVAVVVEHFGSRGQGDGEAAAAAQRRQAVFDGGVGGQPVARDQPVEAAGKRLPELAGAPPPARRGVAGQQAAALPEGDQTAGVGPRS